MQWVTGIRHRVGRRLLGRRLASQHQPTHFTLRPPLPEAEYCRPKTQSSLPIFCPYQTTIVASSCSPSQRMMTEPNSAPHPESDPAVTTDANGTRDQDTDDHKPRDINGWDGKLRVDRMTLSDEPRDPHAQVLSDPEVSDDDGPPPEQLAADEDLLDDVPDDEEDIELVHCKISDMSSLRLERFKQMKVCHCRRCLA